MKYALLFFPIALASCNSTKSVSAPCLQPTQFWIAADQAPSAHTNIENLIVVGRDGTVFANGEKTDSRQFSAFLDDIKANQFGPDIYLVQEKGATCDDIEVVKAELDERDICKSSRCIIGDPREEPPPAS